MYLKTDVLGYRLFLLCFVLRKYGFTVFFISLGVRIYVYSSDVGIAAVALRTDTLLDIFGPAACDEDEVYNPRTTQCVTSSVSLCNPLLIKHGAVECSGLQAGDTCIVACGQGYGGFGVKGFSHFYSSKLCTWNQIILIDRGQIYAIVNSEAASVSTEIRHLTRNVTLNHEISQQSF